MLCGVSCWLLVCVGWRCLCLLVVGCMLFVVRCLLLVVVLLFFQTCISLFTIRCLLLVFVVCSSRVDSFVLFIACLLFVVCSLFLFVVDYGVVCVVRCVLLFDRRCFLLVVGCSSRLVVFVRCWLLFMLLVCCVFVVCWSLLLFMVCCYGLLSVADCC